jgi:DNA repair exonuclease SbcCD nuclease subunit
MGTDQEDVVRLLVRSDAHAADHPPSARKDDWCETVVSKLDQVRRIAERTKAHAVLDCGDLFHVKSPFRNSHSLVRMIAELHRQYPCPVYVVPGNHDSVYGNYAYIDQQPLAVLFASGVLRPLYDDKEALVEEGSISVRLVGVPFHGASYDMGRLDIKRGDERYLVVGAHLLASPQGGSMFEGEDVIRYQDLDGLEADVFCFGHWHRDQGIKRVGDKLIVNIGSLTRGALVQDELTRKPCVALLTLSDETVTTDIIRLDVQPAEEVFDIEARVKVEERSAAMDAFVESIRETLVDEKGTSPEDSVRSLEGIPAAVRERALSYLEKAG